MSDLDLVWSLSKTSMFVVPEQNPSIRGCTFGLAAGWHLTPVRSPGHRSSVTCGSTEVYKSTIYLLLRQIVRFQKGGMPDKLRHWGILSSLFFQLTFVPSYGRLNHLSRFNTTQDQFVIMAGGDSLVWLISASHVMRLVAVSCLPLHWVSQNWSVILWLGLRASVLSLENNLNKFPHPPHSCSIYDIYMGLHPYLRNGGRSGLEIEVEFHEGAILVSTILALCRYHLAYSI